MRGVVAGLAAALACGPAMAQDTWPGLGDEILVYGPATVVVPVTAVELGPEEAAAFEAFSADARYFGALVVDRGPGDWHAWVYGYQSVQAAVEVAYGDCAEGAGEGADCVVFAQAVPEDYRPRLGEVTELGAYAAESFREFLAHETEQGLHTAFAISPVANGWGWNYPSAEAAEIGALQACESSTVAAMETLGTAAQLALRRGGFNACRVIALRSPGGP